MIKLILVLLFVLANACVTAKQWTPAQHQDQMLVCKKMCEPTTVRKYDPFTGDCTCYQPSPISTFQ